MSTLDESPELCGMLQPGLWPVAGLIAQLRSKIFRGEKSDFSVFFLFHPNVRLPCNTVSILNSHWKQSLYQQGVRGEDRNHIC